MGDGASTPDNFEVKWYETILRRELFIQATSTIQLAEKLENSEQYPNDTPPKLCRLLKKTVECVRDHLSKTPTEHLKIINYLLCNAAEYLRYVDRSRVTQTPWSMIQSVESLMQEIVGADCQFIIRPQWAFNYGLQYEFVGLCQTIVSTIPCEIKIDDWMNSLDPDIRSSKIYCLSFPRTLRLNCLSHSNWGHEVGHILVSQWLDKEFPNIWTEEEASIKEAIKKDVESKPLEDLGLLRDLYIEGAVAEQIKEAMDAARQGMEELLCDYLGVHLFGPAALASACECSARYSLDGSPITRGYYPPWRYRLRLMRDACRDDIDKIDAEYPGKYLDSFVAWLGELNSIVSKDSDKTVLAESVVTREVYRLIENRWGKWREEVLKKLPEKFKEPYRLRKRITALSDLVEKLIDDIPPNEIGTWPLTEPASLQDILNAGWAYKIKQSSQLEWNTPENHEKMYRLLLKAIESSYVHTFYNSHKH